MYISKTYNVVRALKTRCLNCNVSQAVVSVKADLADYIVMCDFYTKLPGYTVLKQIENPKSLQWGLHDTLV